MGFQAFVALSEIGFQAFCLSQVHRGHFMPRNISKHPETSWKPSDFQLRVLYEMGFQAFVACITGSPRSFLWWPRFSSRNILKHHETSWKPSFFQPRFFVKLVFPAFVACITGSPVILVAGLILQWPRFPTPKHLATSENILKPNHF